MPTSTRLRRHLQSHLVGYLALFVALSGTALALPGKKQVKSDDLANGAVTTKALASKSVTAKKLRSGAVTSQKLGSGAVTLGKLGAGAVATSAIADGAVTGPKLADDSVARQNIVQGTINGGKIANGAIDSAKVADGSLLAADFQPGQISDGFAATTEPDGASGATLQFPSEVAVFNQPRNGRVLVTATMGANTACAGSCNGVELGLFVDGNYLPGYTRVVGEQAVSNGQNEFNEPTLTAMASLGAGAHTFSIRANPGGAESIALSNVGISGVLLEQ